MPDREVEAYQEGAKAYEDGYPRDANPHQPVQSQLRHAWFVGWDEERNYWEGVSVTESEEN